MNTLYKKKLLALSYLSVMMNNEIIKFGEYTQDFDTSGITFNVIKRTEHEYDAILGTPSSLNSNTTYTVTSKAGSDSLDQISPEFVLSDSPWFSYAARAIKLNPQDSIFTLHWHSSQLIRFFHRSVLDKQERLL